MAREDRPSNLAESDVRALIEVSKGQLEVRRLELENQKRELHVREQENQHNFKLAEQSIEAQVKIEAQNLKAYTITTHWRFAIGGVAVLAIAGFAFMSIYLNRTEALVKLLELGAAFGQGAQDPVDREFRLARPRRYGI